MMKGLFILMALMLLISSSGCIEVTKFLKKDPEPLEVSGFTKGEVKETDDPFPGTQVEYTKDGKEYIVHFGLISKEELRETSAEAPAFVINSVVVGGKSYDIYRSPEMAICVWYYNGWIIIAGGEGPEGEKEVVMELARAYVAEFPPTESLDFLEVLPSAPGEEAKESSPEQRVPNVPGFPE